MSFVIQVLCVTNRAVVLLACSSVLSLVLYFRGFSIFVQFFIFHADCFFFFIFVTDLRHLTVKNSFLNPFLVFPFLSKSVLYSSPGGSLLHFTLNSNWTATHCKRKTWWPSFKWFQCFNLAVLDGGLIAGGLQWELLALSCHTCHQLLSCCSQMQAAPGHFGRACICLLPQPFSRIELHHQNCSSKSFFSKIYSSGCCWGCWVGDGPPRCPPHPTPEALSCSCPTADLGHFSSLLLFGLCHLPCTAVSSNKEYKDSRALRTYFL